VRMSRSNLIEGVIFFFALDWWNLSGHGLAVVRLSFYN